MTIWLKASNRQLSFALLVTIFGSFTLALLSIAEATDVICCVTQFSRYIIYTTFVSILWLKSVRIFVLFQFDDTDMPLQSYFSKFNYQVALVAMVNSVDLVLSTAWTRHFEAKRVNLHNTSSTPVSRTDRQSVKLFISWCVLTFCYSHCSRLFTLLKSESCQIILTKLGSLDFLSTLSCYPRYVIIRWSFLSKMAGM